MLETLKDCPLFAGLSDEQLTMLLPLCRQVVARKGRDLFAEGEPAKALYVIEKGRVALRKEMRRPDGLPARPPYGGPPRHYTIGLFGPGEVVGWSALVDPYVLTSSARAQEQARLIQIDAGPLRALLGKDLPLGYRVMTNLTQVLAKRLIALYDRDTVVP